MGLWDWMKDKLAGETHPACQASPPAPQQPEGAVATLEPPPLEDDADRWWAPENASITELVPVERPPLCAETLALENLLVANFDGHDLTLPPLPRVPELVLRKLASRKYGLSDVACDIAEDQVSAAAVLRLANSPLYRGLDKIIAISPAVVRLGANPVRTLMMHQSMRSLSGNAKGKTKRMAENLSLRALASASVMRALSRFTKVDEEEAFLIGLLHDIGSMIVLRVTLAQRSFVNFDLSPEVFEYLCFETHQEFGELVADAWDLPPSLKAIIASHHTYPGEEDPHREARIQLELTDMIGSLLGYAPQASYDILNSRAASDLSLSDRPDFVAFLRGLPDELEETMAAYA